MKLPMILLWKRHLRPRRSPFERSGGQCSRHFPALRHPWLFLFKQLPLKRKYGVNNFKFHLIQRFHNRAFLSWTQWYPPRACSHCCIHRHRKRCWSCCTRPPSPAKHRRRWKDALNKRQRLRSSAGIEVQAWFPSWDNKEIKALKVNIFFFGKKFAFYSFSFVCIQGKEWAEFLTALNPQASVRYELLIDLAADLYIVQ